MVTMGTKRRKLSQELLDQACMISGHHSIDSGIFTRKTLGILDGDQRRVLGLMEAIDYGCFDYDKPSKDPKGIYCLRLGNNTKEDVEHYLIQHRAVVQSLPMEPFAIGLFAGTFDFLYEGEKE